MNWPDQCLSGFDLLRDNYLHLDLYSFLLIYTLIVLQQIV